MFAMNVAMNQLFPFEEVVRQVKKTPGLKWTPAVPEQFKGMTVEQLKARLNNAPVVPETVQKVRVVSVTATPDAFDNTEAHPECAGTNQDQQQCGSCWAFSATTTLSQGRCIQGADSKFVQYSQEYVVTCDSGNLGCNGGNLLLVWRFLKNTGDVPLSCVSYKSGDGTTRDCPTECDDGSAFPEFVKASDYSNVCTDEESIKAALYNYGSVQTAFNVYYDFEVYSSGIYEHTWGPYMGGHAVTFVGYGEEDGTKYWKVQNSWGTSWGEDGFFRIVRGSNECNIENSCYQGYY